VPGLLLLIFTFWFIDADEFLNVRFCESAGTATGSDEVPALIKAWRLAEAGHPAATYPPLKGRLVPAEEYLLAQLATLCTVAVRRFRVQNLVTVARKAAEKTHHGKQACPTSCPMILCTEG
jgi:hypothetical protein